MIGHMTGVLLVSSSEKGSALLIDMLSQNAINDIVTVSNGGDARRMLIDRDFDLCIVNAPLPDESGIAFAKYAASKGMTQVMLIVRAEHYDEICDKVEDLGIFTISRPISRALFWSAFKLCAAASRQLSRMQSQNQQLLQKIEDIRIIDRAKCVLIEYLKMNEPEAHKYIEKQAMDMRMTRRAVAESILKTYES